MANQPGAEAARRLSPPRRFTFRSWLAEHFELFLTTAGVLVAILLSLAQLERGTQGVALIFLVWLQGFILWAVRRHSLFGRKALLRKTKNMLLDRVNNQLTVMLSAAEIRQREMTDEERQDLTAAVTAARTVSHELETLSLESLRSWEQRYGHSVPRPPH